MVFVKRTKTLTLQHVMGHEGEGGERERERGGGGGEAGGRERGIGSEGVVNSVIGSSNSDSSNNSSGSTGSSRGRMMLSSDGANDSCSGGGDGGGCSRISSVCCISPLNQSDMKVYSQAFYTDQNIGNCGVTCLFWHWRDAVVRESAESGALTP